MSCCSNVELLLVAKSTCCESETKNKENVGENAADERSLENDHLLVDEQQNRRNQLHKVANI